MNDITERDFELNGTSRDAGDSELGGTNEDAGELCWMEPREEAWFGYRRELHCLYLWAETVQQGGCGQGQGPTPNHQALYSSNIPTGTVICASSQTWSDMTTGSGSGTSWAAGSGSRVTLFHERTLAGTVSSLLVG